MEYFFLISAITKYEYFEPILYTEKAALNNNWSFFFLSHMIDSMYTFLKIIRTIVNTWGFQDRYLPHLIHIKITKAYISVIIVKTKTSRLTLSSIVYSTLDFISQSLNECVAFFEHEFYILTRMQEVSPTPLSDRFLYILSFLTWRPHLPTSFLIL